MHWAVAQTQVHREAMAQRYLEQQGYETYYPRIKTALHIRDKYSRSRLTHRIEPLFRSYVFVRIGEQWYPIGWTFGISHIILNGERPAAVPDAEIDRLRSREGPDGLVRLPKAARPEFVRGARIKIIGGAFDGRLGLFENMLPHERVVVMLSWLGSERPVQLDRRYIASV